MLCPQLKQNLETIKTLKLELDLELPRLEELFKIFKNNNPAQLGYSRAQRDNNKAERKDLMNKIKSLKSEISLEINKIEDELPTKKIEVGKEFNLKFKFRKLEEMIEAGNFAWKNDDINSINFPDPQEKELLNQVIKLKAKIFDFKKSISSEDILKELDKEGFRSATLIELLALAEADPELQKQFPVIALGLVRRYSDGRRNVTCLYADGFGRKLGIRWLNQDTSFRFLAIRKSR
jgi:hypothetical protein